MNVKYVGKEKKLSMYYFLTTTNLSMLKCAKNVEGKIKINIEFENGRL